MAFAIFYEVWNKDKHVQIYAEFGGGRVHMCQLH